MGEGNGVVKEREGNRWYATLQGTSAAMGGGWVEWGADKWEWEEAVFSPHTASRDDKEGNWMYICVFGSCISVCDGGGGGHSDY